MTDRVTLTIPAEEDFRDVAHLVAGGLGSRLDLTIDHVDDLQIALDALLGLRDDPADVTVSLEVAGSRLAASVGPFGDRVLDELELDRSELGLRRVLETVCDTIEVDSRDGAQYVELTKRLDR